MTMQTMAAAARGIDYDSNMIECHTCGEVWEMADEDDTTCPRCCRVCGGVGTLPGPARGDARVTCEPCKGLGRQEEFYEGWDEEPTRPEAPMPMIALVGGGK
jgi:hypothetical protein